MEKMIMIPMFSECGAFDNKNFISAKDCIGLWFFVN